MTARAALRDTIGLLQAGLRAHEWVDPANRLPIGCADSGG